MKFFFVIKKSLLLFFAIILITISFSLLSILLNCETIYINNIITDCFYLIICEVLIVIYIINRGFDLFDPLFFVSFIYIMMYFVTPIYDITIGKYYWFGYSLFENGIKTSMIAFLGYLTMYFFYSLNFKFNEKYSIGIFFTKKYLYYKNNSYILSIIYILYIIAFISNMYYLINSGFGNIPYILSLGLIGEGNITSISKNIGFISMLSYSLPTIVLLIWEYEKSKTIKYLSFIPMFIFQVTWGYRFFIVQIIVTFAIYYYLRNKKRPKLKNLFLILLIMMFFLLLMTIFRDSLRGGLGIDFQKVRLTSIIDALDATFWDNLRIYQNVYGMVGVIPNQFEFVGIRQIVIGTLLMSIPRAIWPDKISSYGGESLKTLIGENIASGQAYPTLGEYYYAFGTLGVIFFMMLFGLWLKRLRNKFLYSLDPLNMIYFSVMLGCCLQLIIRGYFPSNFWYLFFAVLPIWIIKLIHKNKKYELK